MGWKRYVRFIAWLWTLLIFVGCLWPGKELPHVDVPLIDKWTHFVLFGGFTLLWLLAGQKQDRGYVFRVLIVAIALGGFIELLQGLLVFLGRSMELMDWIADGVGALLGLILAAPAYRRKTT